MRCLICCGWPCPTWLTSSPASPATCGVAWLVPMKPVRRFPNAHDVKIGVPFAVNPAMSVLLQNDHTQDAKSGPHGHTVIGRLTMSALPPGPATVIADRPKFV